MLTKDAVQSIARLARLKLSETEISAFQAQLSSILNHFEEISAVDTNGVEPLVTPTEMALTFREDKAEATSNPEAILANAPEKSGNLFKVPPVV